MAASRSPAGCHTIFRVWGIVETLTPFARYREGGQCHTPWGDYDLCPAAGFVFGGDSLPALDAVVARACGSLPEDLDYLRLAEARLGPWRQALQVQVPPEVAEFLRPPGAC